MKTNWLTVWLSNEQFYKKLLGLLNDILYSSSESKKDDLDKMLFFIITHLNSEYGYNSPGEVISAIDRLKANFINYMENELPPVRDSDLPF